MVPLFKKAMWDKTTSIHIMENHHFSWENPLYMGIFNSYVKLPEGRSSVLRQCQFTSRRNAAEMLLHICPKEKFPKGSKKWPDLSSTFFHISLSENAMYDKHGHFFFYGKHFSEKPRDNWGGFPYSFPRTVGQAHVGFSSLKSCIPKRISPSPSHSWPPKSHQKFLVFWAIKPPKLEVSWVFRSRKHHKFWEAPHLLENWSNLRLRNPQLLPAGGVPAQKAG